MISARHTTHRQSFKKVTCPFKKCSIRTIWPIMEKLPIFRKGNQVSYQVTEAMQLVPGLGQQKNMRPFSHTPPLLLVIINLLLETFQVSLGPCSFENLDFLPLRNFKNGCLGFLRVSQRCHSISEFSHISNFGKGGSQIFTN